MYKPYVGRRSRLVAQEFLKWLDRPIGDRWLDVGCSTGALSQTILNICNPQVVKGIDHSEDLVVYAHSNVDGPRAKFEVGDAQSLPVDINHCDSAISGLVLNFVPEPANMISEMSRAVKKDGSIAVYVWDYADKM